MWKDKRVNYLLMGLTTITLLAIIVTTIGVRSQQEQTNRQAVKVLKQPADKELDDAATPIVDLNNLDTTSPSNDRVAKSSRYDKSNLVKSEIDLRTANVITESPGDISDIPTDRSDLIVEGTVTDSAAFLSNDKSGVYSEYTITVTDVLKQASDLHVKNGDSVVTERFGGRVRYPNGQIIRYGVIGEGSPMKGKKYLFFLSKTEQGNYNILTAYELRGTRILALDGSRINQRGLGHWAFDKHNDEAYQNFRQAVEQAIKNPPSPSRRFNP